MSHLISGTEISVPVPFYSCSHSQPVRTGCDCPDMICLWLSFIIVYIHYASVFFAASAEAKGPGIGLIAWRPPK